MCPADQSFAGGDYVQEEQISVGHWVTTAGHCPMFGVYFPAYTGTQTHTLTDTYSITNYKQTHKSNKDKDENFDKNTFFWVVNHRIG